jgi:hypothetical protein
MKTIIACVKVQNESDIIESLCRYYCSFCDGILVVDNFSSDNTRGIVESLGMESLPVYIVNEFLDMGMPGIKIKQEMFHLAVDRFNADIILPIDADEFLVNVNGGNPREELEALDEDKEYHIFWRNYVCPLSLPDNTTFFPSCTDRYSDRLPYTKVIISRYLLKKKNAHIGGGSHSLNYPDIASSPPVITLQTLRYAHYSIRSVAHLMTKAIPGWLEAVCWPGREIINHRRQAAWHWKSFYDEIKETGTVSHEQLERCSLMWFPSSPDYSDGDSIDIQTGAFDTSFCKDKLTLRYTDHSVNQKRAMQIILTQIEKNLMNMPSWRVIEEREVTNEQIAIANETIRNLNNHIAQLNKPTDEFISSFPDEILLRYSKYFDKEWYLAAYQDVANAGVDPVKHYLEHGWKEGRNPSSLFSTAYYLDHNPDIKEGGMNPLLHYIKFGQFEDRHIEPVPAKVIK